MRSLRTLPARCLVALACLGLSGCVAEAREGPTQAASPTVTSTSPFASNDEALAAAVAAFQRYVDVDNELSASPDADLGRLSDVSTGEAATTEVEALTRQRERGITSHGPVSFHSTVYEYGSIDDEGVIRVSAFTCIDLSQSRLVDSNGTDVTPATRDDQLEWRVQFVSKSHGSTELILERSMLWNYDGRC